MIGYNKNEIIGKMRERVILQNRVISQSDSGFQSETYSNIATLWTALDYKSGFEEEDADKIVSQQKINFTLRYNENITTNSRFVYRDSLYQIEKIDISNDRRFVFCTGVYRSSYTGSYELTIDVAASVNGSATISANVNSLLYLACQANASASTTATITKIIEVSSLVNANASLSGNINFVQKAQASLLATGTTTADLTVQAAASLLLDLYPSASVAYSLRKLRTAYTGSAVRVRRSSDNTEQDIGFVAGQLDTASLLAFCGVGDGFVQTWYDQSGNANNAIQTTAASQPIIVLSGAIQIQNNSNCINFTASNLNFLNLTYYLSGSAGSRFAILKLKQRPVSQVSSGLPIDEIGSSNVGSYYTNTSGPLADDFASTTRKDPAGDISTNILTSIHIYTTISIPNKFTNWANNNQIFDTNTNTVGYKSTGGTPRIGSGLGFVTNFIDGYLFEIIVYTSDQSLNRTGIESNINTNYAIY
jgi:SPP1 family predicted phage head-tail adaptor